MPPCAKNDIKKQHSSIINVIISLNECIIMHFLQCSLKETDGYNSLFHLTIYNLYLTSRFLAISWFNIASSSWFTIYQPINLLSYMFNNREVLSFYSAYHYYTQCTELQYLQPVLPLQQFRGGLLLFTFLRNWLTEANSPSFSMFFFPRAFAV